MKRAIFCFSLILAATSVSITAADFDVIIKNGAVYNGTGSEAQHVDLAIRGDRIAGAGDYKNAKAKTVIDARGLAVGPGFINMLSWSTESLIQDGRSQSEIRQGVTLEVFGEGVSLGPLTPEMKQTHRERQGDITYDIAWTTLDEGLRYLVGKGI